MGNATNCRIIANKTVGVYGSNIIGCEIRENGWGAVDSAVTISNSKIVGNGGSVTVGGSITDSYVAANGLFGVSGGNVIDR